MWFTCFRHEQNSPCSFPLHTVIPFSVAPSPSELGLSEDSFCEGTKDQVMLTVVHAGRVTHPGSVKSPLHSGRKRGPSSRQPRRSRGSSTGRTAGRLAATAPRRRGRGKNSPRWRCSHALYTAPHPRHLLQAILKNIQIAKGHSPHQASPSHTILPEINSPPPISFLPVVCQLRGKVKDLLVTNTRRTHRAQPLSKAPKGTRASAQSFASGI